LTNSEYYSRRSGDEQKVMDANAIGDRCIDIYGGFRLRGGSEDGR
jgi:hypothetical protein